MTEKEQNEMLKRHCMKFNPNTMIEFGAYVLYYAANPESKMDIPNCVYEKVERMYADWNKSFENCIHGEEEEVKAPYPSYKHLFGESIEQTALRHSNDLINSLRGDIDYAKTIIQDLLNNSDEYARQRAIDYLKENENKMTKVELREDI